MNTDRSWVARAIIVSLSLSVAMTFDGTATAQFSTLNGTVAATGGGTLQQTHSNVEYADLTGVEAEDTIGNEAKANGSLATPAGEIRLSSHGCSGGGPGFGGMANGLAHGQIILDYLIQSSTLPNGTPVSVNVRWAISSSVMAVAQDLQGIDSGASGSATGGVFIAINGNGVLNLSGSYTRTHSVGGGGITNQSTGTLHVEDDEGDNTYTILVGQVIRISLTGDAGSASSAAGTTQADGDVQMGLVWGLTSLDSDAVVVWNNNPKQPAPPAKNATLAHAQEIKPPRDPYLMPCFELPTQPAAAISCVSGAPGFGVATHGTGPFTFQWQIQGNAQEWIDLAVTHTVLPCGGTAYATNPMGTQTNIGVVPCTGVAEYQIRCLVTNPCGSIASNIVPLSLCAADIDCNGSVNVTDLLSVINGWGACQPPPAPCASDVSPIGGNQVTNVNDLLAVINGWGVCQ